MNPYRHIERVFAPVKTTWQHPRVANVWLKEIGVQDLSLKAQGSPLPDSRC
jgi:hypothetical protein